MWKMQSSGALSSFRRNRRQVSARLGYTGGLRLYGLSMFIFHLVFLCTYRTNLHSRSPYHLMEEGQGEQAAMEPANGRRYVQRIKHAMEEEKSVSTLAQYKVCKCSSCLKEATQSLRKGGAQPRHTAKPISLPVCLSLSSLGLLGEFSN